MLWCGPYRWEVLLDIQARVWPNWEAKVIRNRKNSIDSSTTRRILDTTIGEYLEWHRFSHIVCPSVKIEGFRRLTGHDPIPLNDYFVYVTSQRVTCFSSFFSQIRQSRPGRCPEVSWWPTQGRKRLKDCSLLNQISPIRPSCLPVLKSSQRVWAGSGIFCRADQIHGKSIICYCRLGYIVIEQVCAVRTGYSDCQYGH